MPPARSVLYTWLPNALRLSAAVLFPPCAQVRSHCTDCRKELAPSAQAAEPCTARKGAFWGLAQNHFPPLTRSGSSPNLNDFAHKESSMNGLQRLPESASLITHIPEPASLGWAAIFVLTWLRSKYCCSTCTVPSKEDFCTDRHMTGIANVLICSDGLSFLH